MVVFNNKLEYKKYQLDRVTAALKDGKLSDFKNTLSYNTLKTVAIGCMYLIPDGGYVALFGQMIWCALEDALATPTPDGPPEWAKSFFDLSITQYSLDVLKTRFKDINDYKKNFNSYYTTLKANPNSADTKAAVKNSFEDLDRYIITCYNASNAGDDAMKAKLLPMYCMFATLRLAHLRDGVVNGTKYGYSDAMKKTFLTNFESFYTEAKNTARSIYNAGVVKIQGLNSNNGVLEWNQINAFRSNSILFAFDYVNLWYTLHPTKFPYPAAVESVRFLFSDIAGYPVNGSGYGTSGQISFPDQNYYNTPIALINKSIEAQSKFVNDLKSAKFNIKNGRIVTISTFHKDKSKTALIRKDYGGEDTSKLTDADWAARPTINFNSTVDTVTMSFDAFPKQIKVNDATNTTITGDSSSILFTSEEEDKTGWYDIYILPNNGGKTTLDAIVDDNTIAWDTKFVRSKQTGTYKFKDHKIANVFSLGTNKEFIMTYGEESKKLLPLIDTAVFAFLPVDVFQTNLAHKGKVISVVDATKYLFYFGTIYFRHDRVEIGSHAMEISPGSHLTYLLEPEVVDSLFTVGIKLSCDIACNVQILNSAKVSVASIPITKGKNQIFWAPATTNIKLIADKNKDLFSVQNPLGSGGAIFLEALFLKPFP